MMHRLLPSPELAPRWLILAIAISGSPIATSDENLPVSYLNGHGQKRYR